MEMFNAIHKQNKRARKEYLRTEKINYIKDIIFTILATSVAVYFIVMLALYITVKAVS